MTVTIYHNPRCSKSRQALALLHDKGVEPQIVEYLKTPPDTATLEHLLTMLGLMRRKEKEYMENDLANPDLSRDALIAAMVAHPKLIERPIVVKDDKAALGRPPEAVLAIL
jgi:arsenate reductase